MRFRVEKVGNDFTLTTRLCEEKFSDPLQYEGKINLMGGVTKLVGLYRGNEYCVSLDEGYVITYLLPTNLHELFLEGLLMSDNMDWLATKLKYNSVIAPYVLKWLKGEHRKVPDVSDALLALLLGMEWKKNDLYYIDEILEKIFNKLGEDIGDS